MGGVDCAKGGEKQENQKTEEAAHRLACGLAAGIGVFISQSFCITAGKPHDNEVIGLLGTNLVFWGWRSFSDQSVLYCLSSLSCGLYI